MSLKSESGWSGAIASLIVWVGAVAALLFVAAFHWRYVDADLGLVRGLIFYALPLTAAIGLAAIATRGGQETRKMAAASLLAVVPAVYAAEYFIVPPDQRERSGKAEFAARKAIEFDMHSRAEAIADIRGKGIRARGLFVGRTALEVGIEIGGEEVVPVASTTHTVTVACNEFGVNQTYRSDEYGFNNPSGLWSSPRQEIAIVGDSYTYGVCVPEPVSIAGLVRRAHPRTVNLGAAANGPLLMLATLREYLPVLRPRLVLWVFYENDLTDLEREKQSALLIRYIEEPEFSQNLSERRDELDATVGKFLDEGLRKELDRVAAKARPRGGKWSDFATLRTLRLALAVLMGRTKFDYDLHLRVLSAAKAAAEREGGRFVFVYLPTIFELKDAADWTNYRGTYRARLADMLDELDIPVIDTTPVLRAHPDVQEIVPFEGSHYSKIGYALVSQAILDGIERMGLLEPSTEKAAR